MRIAIVGTGIAGLTAAHLLQHRHELTLFEANDYVGGHTNTIAVPEGDRRVPVDTGFIVFNPLNYPRLCALFDALGVASRASDMSFSVCCERTGLEYNGSRLDTLFVQRSNVARPRFWAMLADILRFHRQAPRALAAGLPDGVTVAAWVRREGYGAPFLEHYLVPLGASLWSCEAERFSGYPMRFVLEFLHNHRMLQVKGRPQWRTVVGGSQAYVARLIAPFRERIRLATPVARVRRRARGVEVVTAGGAVERFDEVVLATHADQSLALVEAPDALEREVLAHFPYQPNEAVLHWDTGRLPASPKAWASWNYRIPAAAADAVAVTYNMNRLQGLDTARTYCVSLNQGAHIDPAKVIRRIRYHHPSFLPGRDAAQARHGELIRRRGISYCGAYWGFGFHEDGVRSALDVAAAFDLELEAVA